MMYAFGEYELDERSFELRCAGSKVRVQPRVLDLLFLLVRARDRVVLKRELCEAVWGNSEVSEASISRVILEGRRAIGDELQQTIVTVRGRGFRFTGRVTEREPPPVSRPASNRPPNAGTGDPTFIGREACLAAVGARLDDALARRGSLVWLSGEAGIGKTRTAEEIARRAASRGAVVANARAHEKIDAPPFRLWSDIVEVLTQGRTDDATQRFLQKVSAPLRGPPGTGAQQFELFDAVSHHLVDMSRAKPLVVVLDDLHWADEPSLRLLEFCAGEIRQHAVLIVGTYRDSALRRGPGAPAFGSLLAQTNSLSVPLRNLSAAEVARLVTASTGVAPSGDFTRAVLERSGGNPLYVEQLLKTDWAERALTAAAHEMASTMDLQQGLIETICRHLDAMSEQAREALTLAAMLGREFYVAKLGIVSGLSPDTLLDLLDEAMRASIVSPLKDGRHRFAHALVRDVLYKRLSSSERATRHRTVGERLFAYYGDALDAHAPELADHFAGALAAGGDVERALDLAQRAADQESKLGKHRAAAKHWEQAAQALALLPKEDARHVSVQMGLGRSLLAAGQKAEACNAFFDSAVLARTFGLAEDLAEAALAYASLTDEAAPPRRPLLEQALSTLGDPASAAGWRLRTRLELALSGAPS
jgi:predicted ATPase/DNA-binding winged helix-turn-helix (wHTH) protein